MEFTSFGQADKQAHAKYARQEVMMHMKNVLYAHEIGQFCTEVTDLPAGT